MPSTATTMTQNPSTTPEDAPPPKENPPDREHDDNDNDDVEILPEHSTTGVATATTAAALPSLLQSSSSNQEPLLRPASKPSSQYESISTAVTMLDADTCQVVRVFYSMRQAEREMRIDRKHLKRAMERQPQSQKADDEDDGKPGMAVGYRWRLYQPGDDEQVAAKATTATSLPPRFAKSKAHSWEYGKLPKSKSLSRSKKAAAQSNTKTTTTTATATTVSTAGSSSNVFSPRVTLGNTFARIVASPSDMEKVTAEGSSMLSYSPSHHNYKKEEEEEQGGTRSAWDEASSGSSSSHANRNRKRPRRRSASGSSYDDDDDDDDDNYNMETDSANDSASDDDEAEGGHNEPPALKDGRLEFTLNGALQSQLICELCMGYFREPYRITTCLQ